MKKVVSFFLWFTCLMAVWTCCGEMISAPNTFVNLLGGGFGLAFLLVSAKTRCFTKSWEELINEKKLKTMKKFIWMVAFAIMATLSFSSCERVDAGHEGILVNLYGSDKGVNDVSLVTGMVWYNIFTQQVYEYPTFVQTVDYKPFTINAKDGSEFTVDPTISLKIADGKAAPIFRKYRKDIPDIIEGPLFNHVKDAFRIQLNKFTTDEIVSMRDSLEKAVERQLRATLNKEGFQLEQLTSGLKYPKTIVDAVNAKNKAVQESQRAQNEVAVAEAEARKLVVAAQAEKEANELKAKALTPAVLQQMWIEKWDGVLPTVTSGNQMIMDISKFK